MLRCNMSGLRPFEALPLGLPGNNTHARLIRERSRSKGYRQRFFIRPRWNDCLQPNLPTCSSVLYSAVHERRCLATSWKRSKRTCASLKRSCKAESRKRGDFGESVPYIDISRSVTRKRARSVMIIHKAQMAEM